MLMPAFVLGAAGACSAFIELMENSFRFFLFLHIALAAVRASPACIAVDLAGMGSSISIIDPIFARNRFRPCAYPCIFVLTGVLRMTARAFALGKGMRFGLRCFFGLIAAFSAFLTIPRRNLIGKSGMCSVAVVLPLFAFNRFIPRTRRHVRMIAAILRMTGHAFALIKLMRFGSYDGRHFNFFIQIAVRASLDYQPLNLYRVCLAVRIRLRAQRAIRTLRGGIRMGAFVFIAALLAYILAVIAMRHILFIAIYIGLPQLSAVIALPHPIPVFRNAVRFSIIVCNSVIVPREPFMLFSMLMRTGIFQTAIQAFSIAKKMLLTWYCCRLCCRLRCRLFRRSCCRLFRRSCRRLFRRSCRRPFRRSCCRGFRWLCRRGCCRGCRRSCCRLLICLAACAVCNNLLRNRIGLRQGRYIAHQQSHAHQQTCPFLKTLPSFHVTTPPHYD